MSKARCDVVKEDCWNVDALYPDWESWESDLKAAVPQLEKAPHWPLLSQTRGKLGEGSAKVKETLDRAMEISRKLAKLYCYAHLRHDEDIAVDEHKKNYGRIVALMHDLHSECAWIEPELLALDAQQLEELIASSELCDYRFHLEKIARLKKHTLPPEQEELLAHTAKALDAPHKAFSALNDADFKFDTVDDSQGNARELTHALFGLYLRDQDRTLRENAFKTMHDKYVQHENTMCELLQGTVQGHLLEARTHYFDSCLEAALYPKNIDTSVYHALIEAVHGQIGQLHKYVKLREKVLKVDALRLWDMYVPLISVMDIRKSYPEAEELVIDAVAPLGSQYQELLKEGLKEKQWVDRYENQNKRSGAYSSGCYDSQPYILMNYKGILRDIFTLAHEAGHSMHSFYSNKTQPFHYCRYPIFLAEVASTFNEELLMRLMLERAQSKEEKIFLINEKIEDIRATLFRQTMFAEFELFIHQQVEQNQPLTPKLLNEKYAALNAFYFGPDVIIDDEAWREWARIPHFYYNFYVYQYATGISAAIALAKRVVEGGDKECDEYLTFLKSGCSQYPIDTLAAAGVDMRTPTPVCAAIDKFGALVDQLDSLLAKD